MKLLHIITASLLTLVTGCTAIFVRDGNTIDIETKAPEIDLEVFTIDSEDEQ